MLLDLRDELEAAVERVEQLAVERRDLLAKVGQLDRHVHGLQSACSRRAGPPDNLTKPAKAEFGLPLQRELLSMSPSPATAPGRSQLTSGH